MRFNANTRSVFLKRGLAVALAASLTVPSIANNLAVGPFAGSTDFGLFSVAGLRGTGAGSVTVAGVTGTVTRAILVWHGVATTATALSRGVTVNGTPFAGANIGLSSDNCWSQASSQSFQTDVTSVVTGNGVYALSNMLTAGTFDPNGASLFVFYNDGNPANNRDIAVFWGNDSNIANTFDSAGWSATLSGINYASGPAALNLIVSDGQTFSDAATATINSTSFAIPEYAGGTLPVAPGGTATSGGLWDHSSASVASFLVPGPNTLNFRATFAGDDCLSLVATVFDLPAGTVTPPVLQDPTTAVNVPALSAIGLGGTSLCAALWGVYGLRGRRRDVNKVGAQIATTVDVNAGK